MKLKHNLKLNIHKRKLMVSGRCSVVQCWYYQMQLRETWLISISIADVSCNQLDEIMRILAIKQPRYWTTSCKEKYSVLNKLWKTPSAISTSPTFRASSLLA
ncbi:uncharacterized protein LOC109504163 [Harpegnathos saltator]|uniref:uncharacterized protein LOC109504163 n=1 Tax=Harpegnathos saltator TaxID=610380 RepID=UPI0009488F55|nr:uncharacterized protein LOC109504163 [Harpegnathos saltator]